MAEITDTEVVVPELRKVRLGSLTVKVPPSPTLEYMFWIRRFVKKFQDGTVVDDDIEECFEQTLKFLRRYNKDVDEQALIESCELSELITFYSTCFGQADEEADEAVPPPPAKTRGGATSRGSSRSTSRSRSST